MPNDPKLRVIARRTGQPMALVVAIWASLLDAASQHDPRGVVDSDPEEIAVAQDIEVQAVQDIIRGIYAKGMIDNTHGLTAWNRRQHTTSTEHSRKHRADKRQDATTTNGVKCDATARNSLKRKTSSGTPYTDAEKRPDTDSENKHLRADAEKEVREKEKQQNGSTGEEIGCGEALEQMLDIWNAEVQTKITRGQKAALTAGRIEQMTRRWLEDFQQDMQAWRYYCEIIGSSDFCLGRIPGKSWTINLSWAVESSDHVAKVLEGSFSGGK